MVGVSLSRKDKQTLNHWLEQKRGKPQYRPAPKAGTAVNKVLKPLSKKFGGGGASAAMLSKHWPDIVGARWSKISKPVKFSGGRDGRTLIIAAPGAAATLIMSASGPIIERLNNHLGEGYIARIRVTQTKMSTESKTTIPKRGLSPREEAQLQEGLSKIENNSLKQALEKLGRGVLTDD
ncbi:DUF721 domain-containing protein [Hellea balneolensis]|uniref:DUF721 domain-containing protein n=1 Tax=Hellea balneolensis TaxID=287478 RepID=UPI00041828DC|nr:DciA family protein [Hellea balneolensis]